MKCVRLVVLQWHWPLSGRPGLSRDSDILLRDVLLNISPLVLHHHSDLICPESIWYRPSLRIQKSVIFNASRPLLHTMPFSCPIIADFCCQATKAADRKGLQRGSYAFWSLLCIDDCWLASPISSLLHSLPLSLPLSLTNLHCTERSMWRRIVNVPSCVNVCMCVCFRGEREAMQERR